MKGAGFAWIFGLLMVLLVVAAFAVGVVSHYNAQVSIVSGAVEAYDTVNVGEFVKRALDGAAFTSATVAANELGPEGGGYTEWTTSQPSIQELMTKLGDGIATKMEEVDFNGLTRREIGWRTASAEVTSYEDDNFMFRGNKPFTVDSSISTPEVHMEDDGSFSNTVYTSYFKLLRLGRAAAVCQPSLGDTTVESFSQSITNVSTDTALMYSVTVTDPAGPALVYSLMCP